MAEWKEEVCEHIQALLDALYQQESCGGAVLNSQDSVEVECEKHHMYVELWLHYPKKD